MKGNWALNLVPYIGFWLSERRMTKAVAVFDVLAQQPLAACGVVWKIGGIPQSMATKQWGKYRQMNENDD